MPSTGTGTYRPAGCIAVVSRQAPATATPSQERNHECRGTRLFLGTAATLTSGLATDGRATDSDSTPVGSGLRQDDAKSPLIKEGGSTLTLSDTHGQAGPTPLNAA
jgi:hypothetical protein